MVIMALFYNKRDGSIFTEEGRGRPPREGN
jgi:hypothetical protein